MAATIFSDQLLRTGHSQSLKVISAGLAAQENQRAPALVQQVMDARGLDISAHLSQIVTKELLEQSALVLVMEKRQQEILRIRYPDLASRIALLSEMAGLSFDIADPNHDSLPSIQATAREIERL
jgi:protein-tyrosine-phosphatase